MGQDSLENRSVLWQPAHGLYAGAVDRTQLRHSLRFRSVVSPGLILRLLRSLTVLGFHLPARIWSSPFAQYEDFSDSESS
jgi:hypothetical protein